MILRIFKFSFLLLGWLVFGLVAAQQRPVTLAGFAYSGDAQTIEQRFPYSLRYEQFLKERGTHPFALLNEYLKLNPPQNITISDEMIDKLAGKDQAVAVALVVNSETISQEIFGSINKLTVQVKGQAMFFDFKSMTVLRSYPISFSIIDLHNRPLRESDVYDAIQRVYEGGQEKNGLFARFTQAVATATIPDEVPRFIQVTNVTVTPEALETLPDYLKSSESVAQTWIADMLSESLSQKVGVPIIPYAKGYAVGNILSMRVSDGRVYNLKLPQPDYEIHIEIPSFKKVLYKEVEAGASYVYGSYANIKLLEPLSNTMYFDSGLKNAEIKVVPATQTYVDDFPAFHDSIAGLFNKLGERLNGGDDSWISKAAASSDIDDFVTKTIEVLEKCK